MKQSWKGSALLAPVPPVMVSCGEGDKANIITIAWSGIINSNPPKTYISVRPERYSYNIIKNSGEFVINLTTTSLVRAADYCGTFTGAKVNKFEKCRLTPEKTNLSCPAIAESPLNLECKVTDIIPLGTHDMFIADIVGVNVDESILDASGKMHMEKAHLAAYAHGEYFALGERIGKIGFAATKKKPPQKTTQKKK